MNFGPAISEVCPITFLYQQPPGDEDAQGDTDAAGRYGRATWWSWRPSGPAFVPSGIAASSMGGSKQDRVNGEA